MKCLIEWKDVRMKKIILLACDPGGANTVAPLLEPLCLAGYNVTLFGKDSALMRYKVIGKEGQNLSLSLEKFDFEDVLNFIKSQKPDLVITGTSSEDFTEKYTWQACFVLKIPCFAILDQWMNYGVRFSKYRASEIESYNQHKDHSFLPTKIFVMDEFAKQKMIQEGITAEKIVVTGQPYFDWLSNVFHPQILKLDHHENKILFISEPISQTFNNYRGYTEESIFIELVKALELICKRHDLEFDIGIKLHPREDKKLFTDLISRLKSKFIKFRIIQELNLFKLFSDFDIVCGMASMALLEAALLKKNVISIQIGLEQENPFILDILGVLKSIKNQRDLVLALKSVLVDKNRVKCDFDFVSNAIKNVIAEIEEIFHGNEQNKRSKSINKNNGCSCN